MATKKTWRGGQWVDVPVDNSGKEITGTPTADKPQTTPATSSGSRDTNSIIQQAYHNVLGRAPDPTGQAYYSGILGREPQTGLSQLETALKASDEYKNKPQELSSPDQNNLAGYNETNPVVNSSTEYRSYTNQLKADIDAYELSSQETLAQLAEMSQGKPQEALDKEISEIESKINVDRQHIAEQKKLADEQENLEEKSYTQGMKDVGVDVRQLNIEIAKNQRTLNHKKLELSYQREIQLLNDNRMSQVDRAKKEWEQGNYEMAKWAMDSAMDIEDRLNDKKQKLWDAQMDYEDQQRKDLEAEQDRQKDELEFSQDLAEGLAPAIFTSLGDDESANAALIAAIARENNISPTFLMSALQEYQMDYLGNLQNTQFTLGNDRFQLNPDTGGFEVVASKPSKATASQISRFNKIQGFVAQVNAGEKQLKDVPAEFRTAVEAKLGTGDTEPTGTEVPDSFDSVEATAQFLENIDVNQHDDFTDDLWNDAIDSLIFSGNVPFNLSREEVEEMVKKAKEGLRG